MKSIIQVYKNDEFGRLEILTINGKPYFPATECAIKLGYSKHHNAVERHCRYSLKRGVPHPQSPNKTIEVNYIPEGDLYRLIIRSKLPAAIRFEAWVCDVVLPSIRANGAYITEDTLNKMREDKAYADELLGHLSDERARNSKLQDYIGKIEPKALYFDTVLQCPDVVQVSIIAKDYGMSAVRFNKLLHALGIQYKVGKTWVLYSPHEGKGYTVTKTNTVNDATTIVTCFTQKGRLWLYKVLKIQGILPKAERPKAG